MPPLSPNKTATPERKREKSMEWEREAGEKGVEEAFRGRERERQRRRNSGSDGWQALLGAESDMAVGDR